MNVKHGSINDVYKYTATGPSEKPRVVASHFPAPSLTLPKVQRFSESRSSQLFSGLRANFHQNEISGNIRMGKGDLQSQEQSSRSALVRSHCEKW